MSKNPFIILGVDEQTVTQSELEEAYKRERAKYEEDRFLEGREGEIAARKVSEIDEAYNEALEKLKTRASFSDKGVNYAEIEAEIRAKNYNEAQSMLDSITVRDAEWHFLQSVIYYKKGWVSESRIQLERAVSLEPNNPKYKSELDKMTSANTNANQQFANHSYGYGAQNRSYSHERPTRQVDTCDCCSTLCALDCCCECMGGDLIPCC